MNTVQAVNSDHTIFFNQNDEAGQSHENEDDNISVLSHMMSDHEDVGVNTSPTVQSTPETNNVNEVLNSITGVLKDVVTELRSLKQSQCQSLGFNNDNSSKANEVDLNSNNHRFDDVPPNGRLPHMYRRNWQEYQITHDPVISSRFQIQSGNYQPDVNIPHDDQNRRSFTTARVSGFNKDQYVNFQSPPRITGNANVVSDRYAQPPHVTSNYDDSSYTHYPVSRYSASNRNEGTHFKVAPFTGKEEWKVWIARFEAIVQRYGWSDEKRLDQILPRIKGQATEFVFTQLQPNVLLS
jgi:hypothetical protein